MSGMYAPVPGCANCKALKEMCLECAMSWRMEQWQRELTVLRQIARRAHLLTLTEKDAKLWALHEKWLKERKKKPARKERRT